MFCLYDSGTCLNTDLYVQHIYTQHKIHCMYEPVKKSKVLYNTQQIHKNLNMNLVLSTEEYSQTDTYYNVMV